MKVIIAGSRTITCPFVVQKAVDLSCFQVSEVVCGMALGVDQLGLNWATRHNIPVARFPAMLGQHGKSAGFIRNAEMADYADALIAIWDGKSRGTQNMIENAHKKGLKVFIYKT